MTYPLSKVFVLKGYKGSNRYFNKAVVILPELTDYRLVQGAWNYAIRKTSSGYDTVNYDAALEWLRKNHPDWLVTEQTPALEITFEPNKHHMDYYTPPDKEKAP